MSAGHSETDSSATECHHQLRVVREWFDDLCLLLRKLHEPPWVWIARSSGKQQSEAQLRWQMLILELEACRQHSTDPPDIAGLESSLLSACECVESVSSAVQVCCSGWKWHLVLSLRRLLGLLGIKQRRFRTLRDDADDTMAQFREWSGTRRRENPPNRCNAPCQSGSSTVAPLAETLFEDYLLHDLECTQAPFWEEFKQANAKAIEACLTRRGACRSQLLVSIIMPSYNRAAILADGVRTVIDQTYRNWELLVCDDGSQDETEDVVNTFDDPRIAYIKLSHAGGASARNAGLAKARGEYIAYLDTDNLWHPQFLEVMINSLEFHRGSQSAHCLYLEEREGPQGQKLLEPGRAGTINYEKLVKRNWMDLNTFIHRRDIYEALGGFTEGLPRLQDWDLFLKYCFALPPLQVDAVLALYRRRASWRQLTTNARSSDTLAIRQVRENLDRYYKKGPVQASFSTDTRSVSVVTSLESFPAYVKGCNLAKALRRNGYEVRLVLTGPSSQCSDTGLDNLDIPILQVPMPESHLRNGVSLLEQAAARIEGDLIYCVGDDWTSQEFVLRAHRQTGVPVAFEVLGNTPAGSLLEDVDFVPIAHSHALGRRSGKTYSLLRNMADERVFDPERYDRNESRRTVSCQSNDKVLALFLEGDYFPDSAKALCRSLSGFRILAPHWIERALRVNGGESIPNLAMVHVSQPDELARLLQASDAAMFLADPSCCPASLSLPYAFSAALAMRTPVFATPAGEMADLIWQGYCFPVNKQIVGRLDSLMGDQRFAQNMTTSAAHLFIREFSYRAAAVQFHFIYQFAVVRKRSAK